MTVERHGDLELDQDLSFQRRDWRVQRVGWVVMTLLILAAMSGAFGHGPLARETLRSTNGRLEVEYERIARHGSRAPLNLQVLPGPLRDTILDVWISNEFLDGLRIERIEPEPSEQRAGDASQVFRFRVADPSRPSHIVFHAEPDAIWGRRGMIGLVEGDSVRIKQYVLP